ncbi:Autophagy-related protein 37 [Lasiodiplodia hormozganensis]|uniref:Autophagy-related protein 37 n=1 Tax=Lasiodiplodia hormozganensis TaxID=869390 RepID=A0AA40CST8_9PEZI|nr:Autophagy-related protein 37 [Lasiodiplodia hormozganensis]
MSDSVDRVFSHALNTVNKIRIGSEKPPSAIRLKLYGLYKQSMEGDVDGIMERPEGDDEQTKRSQEKWDAWKQQNGLSRTEAKRRYITTLIDTMHKYASPSPDARELVAELEFVWDQVKSNVPSSSSSSPHGLGMPSYPALGSSRESHEYPPPQIQASQMRILTPAGAGEEEAGDDNDDEFVDAQDSGSHHGADANPRRNIRERPPARERSASDKQWRLRVEQALVKLTAEVAALREQLESRRLFQHTRRRRFLAWVGRFLWFIVKLVAADMVILGIILLWMRRKKDRRLEGAIRVLLGDAVVQMQRVGSQQVANIGKIQLPKLPAKLPMTKS